MFRNKFGKDNFNRKYSKGKYNWKQISNLLVNEIFIKAKESERELMRQYIYDMKFIPGGRYLYYAGLNAKYINNCFALRAEDTKEGWADVLRKTTLCLMCGGGVGINYSNIRPKDSPLVRCGGLAGGPLALAQSVNDIANHIQQGGTRRSALLALIMANHKDVYDFLNAKKEKGQMSSTNISIQFKPEEVGNEIWDNVIESALTTGEPGLFNLFDINDLSNPCGEIRTSKDSNCCNLGSLNLSRIDSLEEFEIIVELATKYLMNGSIVSEMPYDEAEIIKRQDRNFGLGLMGIHEWLIKRNYKYEVVPELKDWLKSYKEISDDVANSYCRELGCNKPVFRRAIAPTGTLSILSGTSSGIEPIFALTYKRRFLDRDVLKFEYLIDPTADYLINECKINPSNIQTAYNIPFEDRVKFQADVQDYVDQAISSTININKKLDKKEITEYNEIVKKYFNRLKGITFYPNGAIENQPLENVSYEEYLSNKKNDNMDTFSYCKLDGSCGS